MVHSSPHNAKDEHRDVREEEHLEEELLFIQSPFSKWNEKSGKERGKKEDSNTGRRGSAVAPRVLEHQPLVLKTSFSTSAAEHSLVVAATSKTRKPVISKHKRSFFYLTLNYFGFQRRIV